MNFDIMSRADLASSEWEYCIQSGYFTKKDAVDLFKNKLITADEYIYAIDYLGEENVYTARANELYRRLGYSRNNEPEQMENPLQIMG